MLFWQRWFECVIERCFLRKYHKVFTVSWWRHQMETFSTLLAICAGNSPITSEFPAQRPVTRSLDVFFDLHLNKRLSKQWWGWWLKTPSRPLWRQCIVKQAGGKIMPTHFRKDYFGKNIRVRFNAKKRKTNYILQKLSIDPQVGFD